MSDISTSNNPAIIATHLGKAYKNYSGRLARLKEWLDIRNKPRHSLNWVLKDLNFTIPAGQAVGIIGINGAGKSTLLKIITGISTATQGEVKINGRVAALLELGLGFHSEFTGRQNIYIAGQLLGYSPKELDELLPSIEAFAEIGDYLDQPVRVYSSGMQMRLAFSLATAKRPDILIVDEALSVGDMYFQHKSFERIRQFKKEGTTLLLVSHDKQAIQSICDTAILLDAGQLVMQDKPEAVMDYYNALLAEKNNSQLNVKQEKHSSGKIATSSGTGEARVIQVQLLNAKQEVIEAIGVGAAVTLRVTIKIHENLPELVFGYLIKDRLGQEVFGTNTYHLNLRLTQLKAGEEVQLDISFDANLGVGSYSITTALHTRDSHLGTNYDWQDLALVFTVININKPTFNGVNWLDTQIRLLR